VVVTNTVVQIQPSNPEVVYVPTYSPAVVYYPPPAYVANPYPLLTFGAGMAMGAIIANNCDWHGGGCYNNNVNVDIDRTSTGTPTVTPLGTRPGRPNGRARGIGERTEVAAGSEPLEQERFAGCLDPQRGVARLWFRRCQTFNWQRRSASFQREQPARVPRPETLRRRPSTGNAGADTAFGRNRTASRPSDFSQRESAKSFC
jgi:hypothetical protein